MPRKLKIINLLSVIVIILAACSTGSNESANAELPAPQQEVAVNTPTHEPMAEEPKAEEGDAEDAAAPAQAEGSESGYELGFTQGDPNLKATDPTSVNLAAGKPQLVEFFAFW